jgi:BirA family biotin operon repressor/biotin-[acetyl-CoA-carboxylase] ligase
LEIYWFDRLDSTQLYLIKALRSGQLKAPVAVATRDQPAGIGSRHNQWLNQPGNLFFSFALSRHQLPSDLPLQSVSIYMGFLLVLQLRVAGSSLWMKWPNDLYLGDRKIGGVVTQVSGEWVVCGIGLNRLSPQPPFGALDLTIEPEKLLVDYLENVTKCPLWKNLFSRFEIEFERSRSCQIHTDEGLLSLGEADLNEDGSVTIESRRVYSER